MFESKDRFLFGGAGGVIVALRKRFAEPPSRHSLYLSGERMVEII